MPTASSPVASRARLLNGFRALAGLLALLVLVQAWMAGHSDRLFGDLDIDGTVTVSDVVLCLRIIVGLTPSTPDLVKRGDVSPVRADGATGDGEITVGDAVRLLRRVAGLEPDPWP